jgi:hypothetical protein
MNFFFFFEVTDEKYYIILLGGREAENIKIYRVTQLMKETIAYSILSNYPLIILLVFLSGQCLAAMHVAHYLM